MLRASDVIFGSHDDGGGRGSHSAASTVDFVFLLKVAKVADAEALVNTKNSATV